MSDDLLGLADFSGTAPLFPLPNLVLFPQVVQPLHIFEPRYRQMTADALASDRLLALALLRPGWGEDYEARPAIHPVVCLGRILAEQRLDDGRYNLLLRGLRRARIVQEVDGDALYRSARLDLLTDSAPPAAHLARRLRRQLTELVPAWFEAMEATLEQFRKLWDSDLDLATLADVLSFALPLDLEFKQTLLEELDVTRRVRRLLQHLRTGTPAQEEEPDLGFPPEFSNN